VQTALEELRIADRELLGAQGSLEQNLENVALWMQDYNRRRPIRGEVRRRELEQALEDADVAWARIVGVGERTSLTVPEPSTDAAPELPIGRWTRALRHAHAVHEALWRLHTQRRAVRAAFEAWSAETDIEPLSPLPRFEDEHQRRREHLLGVVRGYTFRAGGVVVFPVGFASWLLYVAMR